MTLQINNISHSFVNGPGRRLVIWTQGCRFKCDGCFNSSTHSLSGGRKMEISELVKLINDDLTIDGITISGGEPMLHPIALGKLLKSIDPRLTKIVFTGYSLSEIKKSRWKLKILKYADLVIAGRYIKNLPHPYVGKVFLKSTDRIDLSYFKAKKAVEYAIAGNSVTKTGIF